MDSYQQEVGCSAPCRQAGEFRPQFGEPADFIPLPESRVRRWVGWNVSLVCLATLIVACYGGVLFGGLQFGFRDSAHFFYPLYFRVQQEWASGRLPLWEPGANGGTPMLGSPVAAVFYPGKLLFAWVPYAWGMRLYVVAHEVLAFFAMVALVRSWGVSRTGSTIAGLSYAFGGPVLSYYCNVIYLVGAAWAPLGFRAADRWLRLGRSSALPELTLVLAMQVLGGDPEAAYLTVLCACGYALGLARAEKQSPARPWLWGVTFIAVLIAWSCVGPVATSRLQSSGGPWRQVIIATAWAVGVPVYAAIRGSGQRVRLAVMFLGLAGSCLLAMALTAVQLFPVLEQTAMSVRWSKGRPIDLYDFSLVPYRSVEWVWPNVFGTLSHGSSYWEYRLPPFDLPIDGHRSWSLTLYFGALPLVLALGAAGLRGGPCWRVWMTAVAALSLFASVGAFAGPAAWLGGKPSYAGDDSLFGLLVTILPGLRFFRFPGKFLVLTALALSALAGLGWDRVASGLSRRRVMVVTWGLLIVTAVSLAVAVGFRARLVSAMGGSRQNLFGPIDAPGAVAEMVGGFVHGLVALASVLIVVGWCRRRPAAAGLAALAFLTADLAWANARQVIVIPQADFVREPEVLRAIRAAERAHPTSGPFRVHRLGVWFPPGWSETGSNERLRDLTDWELNTLVPGFGLLHGINYVLTDESQTGRADFWRLFRPAWREVDSATAATLGVEPGHSVVYHPRRVLDLWGARYFILPSYPADWTSEERSYAAFLDQTELIYPDPVAMEGPERREEREKWRQTKDVQVRRNKAAYPRAWVVHDLRPIRPLGRLQSAARDALSARLGFGDDLTGSFPSIPTADLRSVAYIEADDPGALAPYRSGGPAGATESVTVRYDSPTRVVLEAYLDRPGLIVLADIFDPGWRLAIDGHRAPIWCANLSMRAAAVTAGPHRMVYTYEPASVKAGAWVSMAGLATLIGLIFIARSCPVVRVRGLAEERMANSCGS
jgi:hypothetical protein